MSNFDELEKSVLAFSGAAELCDAATSCLLSWAKAVQTGDLSLYKDANNCLANLIDRRIERIAIVSPLQYWDSLELNILLLRPLYISYNRIKEAQQVDVRLLPLHVPVEIEAGLGPYATGSGLVLTLNTVCPGGHLFPPAKAVSFEFMNVWRERLLLFIPWLLLACDQSTQELLQQIVNNSVLLENVVLQSILLHELGHVHGPWPHYPNLPNFQTSVLDKASMRDRLILEHAACALADLSADLASVETMTDELILTILIYHLINVARCWVSEPFTSDKPWEPMHTDPDCLNGVLVGNAVITISEKMPFISIEQIREGFKKLATLLDEIIGDLKNGFPESLLNITNVTISSPLQQLLDCSPFSDHLSNIVPLQQQRLKTELNKFMSDLTS